MIQVILASLAHQIIGEGSKRISNEDLGTMFMAIVLLVNKIAKENLQEHKLDIALCKLLATILANPDFVTNLHGSPLFPDSSRVGLLRSFKKCKFMKDTELFDAVEPAESVIHAIHERHRVGTFIWRYASLPIKERVWKCVHECITKERMIQVILALLAQKIIGEGSKRISNEDLGTMFMTIVLLVNKIAQENLQEHKLCIALCKLLTTVLANPDFVIYLRDGPLFPDSSRVGLLRSFKKCKFMKDT
ncbi:hypothetical protein FH972_013744 [Carpinus fangiana]|uniref:Uncharacterized protein n=1 Tax=Carpinus fangiana TaxID=176857 RepID=A0A5N6R7N9_9ROSI|nr:hypothetical protein FH972_013744 [Carpinus fangiana]